MATYRVYWTETIPCVMEVETNGSPETAINTVKHICKTEEGLAKTERSFSLPDNDSFHAFCITPK